MSKLIRQRIDVPPTRVRPVRDREELLTLLRAKLLEEAFEVVQESANGYDVRLLRDELADVLEVVDALIEAHGLASGEVQAAQQSKFRRLGGFHPGRVYT